MNHYQNLINYIDSLIRIKAQYDEDGYSLSVHDLDDEEQGELAVLFLEYEDRDTTDCFRENKPAIDDEITCALLRMLKENSYESKEELAEIIRKNSIKNYQFKMQEWLDKRCHEVEAEDLLDHGKTRRRDQNTGQFHIVRI